MTHTDIAVVIITIGMTVYIIFVAVLLWESRFIERQRKMHRRKVERGFNEADRDD